MDGFNDEIRIVLVGKTGTGKSSFGNIILNHEEFKAECQVLAVTDKASFGTRVIDDKKLIVVDTPGMLDNHRNREEMKNEIIRSVGLSFPGPHAVLYVMRIGDRLTDDDHHCIRIFTDMFGEHIFEFVIVVFTKANDLEGKPLTGYFQKAPEPFQKLLNKCSNRMLAIDKKGTNSEKNEAVDNLLGMIYTMNDGQKYYSDSMLKSAQVAFMSRVDENDGQVNNVRREIQLGGIAFRNLALAVGLGGVVGAFTSAVAIAGPVVVVTKVGDSAAVAAKFAKVAGSVAIVAAKACGTVGGDGDASVVEALDDDDEEDDGLSSKCSIL